MPLITIQEFNSDLGFFLRTMRYSIERPRLRKDNPNQLLSEESRILILLELEKLRISSLDLRSFGAVRRHPEYPDIASLVDDTRVFIEKFTSGFFGAIFDLELRLVPGPIAGSGRHSSFSSTLPAGVTHLTSTEFLRLFDQYLNEVELVEKLDDDLFKEFEELKQASVALRKLRKIVPEQRVAPVQFEVVGGKICVVDKQVPPSQGDKGNIDAALAHLNSAGRQLIESLKNSNCDPRLLNTLQELQAQIIEHKNIVQVGLSNLACDHMCKEFSPELSPAIASMFAAYTSSVSMYVAQFPDWQKFNQNAAEIEIAGLDVSALKTEVALVIDGLNEHPELSEPRVPESIKLVRELIDNPSKSGKRGVYAVLRTIENLVSAVYKYTTDLVSKTAEKSIDALSTKVAKHLVSLVIIVAAFGPMGGGAAALNVIAPWAKEAGEIVLALLKPFTPLPQ